MSSSKDRYGKWKKAETMRVFNTVPWSVYRRDIKFKERTVGRGREEEICQELHYSIQKVYKGKNTTKKLVMFV